MVKHLSLSPRIGKSNIAKLQRRELRQFTAHALRLPKIHFGKGFNIMKKLVIFRDLADAMEQTPGHELDQ